MTQKSGEAKPFPFLRALKDAMRSGLIMGVAAAGSAGITVPEPTIILALGTVGFVGGTISSLDGAYVAHKNDDALFDRPTVFLFDTTVTIVCLMLFVVPALHLDKVLRPDAPLPGWYGFAAMFLSAYLIPVLRGLLCNLGLARQPDEEVIEAPRSAPGEVAV